MPSCPGDPPDQDRTQVSHTAVGFFTAQACGNQGTIRHGELESMEIWEASHPGPAPGLTGTPQHPVEPSFLPAWLPARCPGSCPRPLDSVCLRPTGVGRPVSSLPRWTGSCGRQDAGPAPASAGGQEGWGGASGGPRVRGVLGLLKQKALGSLQGAGHPRGTELSQRGTSVSQGPCDWETQGGGSGLLQLWQPAWGSRVLPASLRRELPWHPQPGAWGEGWQRGGGC